MTKKRFTYEYDEYNGNLFDNKMNTFYHIEDSDENIEILCDRLNWLVEENEQLKERIKELEKWVSYMKNNKKTLEDIQKLVNSIEVEEVGEGRFQEIVSTQKIVDTKTGKEYDGMVDVEFLRWINDIDERFQNKRKENDELKEVNGLLWDMVDGFHAYFTLKKMGYFE